MQDYKCTCGGDLVLLEWGTYSDKTPIDRFGRVIAPMLVSLGEDRTGWAVKCSECGLELTSDFALTDRTAPRRIARRAAAPA